MEMRGQQGQTSYRVEISAHAWLQVGVLSRQSFLRLMRALEEVAARVEGGERAAVWMQTAVDGLRVDGHELRYRVDETRRTITLLEVLLDAPEPS